MTVMINPGLNDLDVVMTRIVTGPVYYVAKTGSDSYNGSESRPWLTIQHGINSLVAGDTLLVRGGTYNELVSIVSRPAHINVMPYPGEPVLITGAGKGGKGLGIVTIRNSFYLTLAGFEVAHSDPTTGGYGVFAYRTNDHLTLKLLKVHDINQGGLQANGYYTHTDISHTFAHAVTNLLIDGCEVYDTNRIVDSDEQCSLVCVNGSEIINSIFYDSGLHPLGRTTTGKNSVDFKEGCLNVDFHHSEVYGQNPYGSVNVGPWESLYIDCRGNSDNLKVHHNRFHGTSDGVAIADESGGSILTNLEIFNNLFYDIYRPFRVYSSVAKRNYRFINNTLYHNYYGPYEHAGGNNQNCIIRNNIVALVSAGLMTFPNAVKPTIDHNLYYNPTYNFSPSSAEGSSSIRANPLLASDLSIPANSPAVGKGSPSLAPVDDFIGALRDGRIDIGAYQAI